MAEVARWVRRRPVKPGLALMYSMTWRHVYWYEYQFCTSRAKTTVSYTNRGLAPASGGKR